MERTAGSPPTQTSDHPSSGKLMLQKLSLLVSSAENPISIIAFTDIPQLIASLKLIYQHSGDINMGKML